MKEESAYRRSDHARAEAVLLSVINNTYVQTTSVAAKIFFKKPIKQLRVLNLVSEVKGQ